MAKLSNIDLGTAIQWVNRYSANKVSQTTQRTLAGSVVVYHGGRTNGFPISLHSTSDSGWLKKAVLDQVKSLADQAGLIMPLEVNGEQYNVMFAHESGNALEATPIFPYNNPTDDTYYRVKMEFITV